MFKSIAASRTFYEFFAGSGMVRAGLGDSWTCLFANDFDGKKAAAYQENWGGGELLIRGVGRVSSCELPEQACWTMAR
jgi:DNA (cytosine-5)-methyltransferase 1